MFRFHLLRCGDWQQAEQTTTATFFRSFSSQASDSPDEALNLLYRSALAEHGKRGGVSLEEGSIPPTQEQVQAFAWAAQVADVLRSRPRAVRDALALTLSGALPLSDAANLAGISSDRLQKEMLALSGRLQNAPAMPGTVGYFAGRLEAALNAPHALDRLPRRREFPAFHLNERWARAARWLPLLAAFVLLGWGVWTLREQAAQEKATSEPLPAPTPTSLPQAAFEPTGGDAAILTNENGNILWAPLDGGEDVVIGAAGFWKDESGFDLHLSLSPDGRWLSAVNSADQSTWLLRTDGQAQVRISDSPLDLIWAPDGKQAAYVNPQDARQIYVLNPETARTGLLTATQGPILGLAWAPNGQSILAAYATQLDATDSRGLSVKVYGIGQYFFNGSVVSQIYALPGPGLVDSTPGVTLLWGSDGRALWVADQQLAIYLPDQSLRPVVGPPVSGEGYMLQQSLISSDRVRPQVTQRHRLSPDGKQAMVLIGSNYTGSGNPENPGTVAVISAETYVKPTFQLPEYTWSQYFGSVLGAAWAGDSRSLIVSAWEADAGYRTLRLNAGDGQPSLFRQGTRLLGMRSQLVVAALQLAPEVDVAHGLKAGAGGQWKVIENGKMGFSVNAPLNWQAFEYSEREWGFVEVSNYKFSSPFGYAMLSDPDISVRVERFMYPPDQSKETTLDDLKSRPSGEVTPVVVGGREAYQVTPSPEQVRPVTYIVLPLEKNVLVITQTTAANPDKQTLRMIVSSILIKD